MFQGAFSPEPQPAASPAARTLVLTVAAGFVGAACWWAFELAMPALQPYFGMVFVILLLFWAGASGYAFAQSRTEHGVVVGGLLLGAFTGLLSASSGLVGGFALLAGILALIGLLAWIAGKQAMGAPPSTGLLSVAFAILAFGATTLLVGGGLQAMIPPVPTTALVADREVERLFEADQLDRLSGSMLIDSSRDRRRLARIQALDEAGQLASSAAKYRAAMIYLHGSCPDHFRRAAELSRAAAAAGLSEAVGLAKASEDRWLLSLGQLQRHGTQLIHWGGEGC